MVFWHFNIKPFVFTDLFAAVDFITMLITVFVVSFVLSLLSSLVPVKNTTYKSRLMWHFPTCLILLPVGLVLNIYLRMPRYDKIAVAEASTCASVKDGVFQMNSWLIIREGNKQTQTNLMTHEKEEFTVTWLSDCEYELSSSNEVRKVKIVSVDENGFDCHVESGGYTSRRMRLNKK